MGMDEPQAYRNVPGSDMSTAPNTPAQVAFHEAQEAVAMEQASWPLYKVVITGDDVEWVPRNDERYWELSDPDDPNSDWVSKTGNPVIMPARGTVTLRARSEDEAKMMALRDNPDYHTVESVEDLEG